MQLEQTSQVFLLVGLTLPGALPLIIDEPDLVDLIDKFWDYFFFFAVGLPLDPGSLMAKFQNFFDSTQISSVELIGSF